VRLLVASESLEAARELLVTPGLAGDAPWTCAACDAPGEPGFDACWRCGAPRA
jgi:hypothetical protein